MKQFVITIGRQLGSGGKEIAEKLGRPLNTIKTQIRRARATICKMIIDKE